MSKLFSPLKIRGIELKNRIAVSPMCQYSSVDGFANDWHLVHLGSRAVGGAGLIITEATAVTAMGRITPDDLGIWKDEHIPFLKRITTFIESQHAVAGIQLAHAGRKASHHSPWKGNKSLTLQEGSWPTQAPSGIPYRSNDPLPIAMSTADIMELISDFTKATVRSMEAGFQLIEIHAAHGYLIHEFLSPLSNQRNDDYGGSFENRSRLLLQIIKALRSVMPASMPLFVRISASDWVEGGWTIDDSARLSGKLLEAGVDLVDCSSGGNSPLQQIPVKPMYQVPFAEQIKKACPILVGAVGLITTTEEANSILEKEQADLVIMARQFLRDPYFPLHAAQEAKVDIEWPVQYQRAR